MGAVAIDEGGHQDAPVLAWGLPPPPWKGAVSDQPGEVVSELPDDDPPSEPLLVLPESGVSPEVGVVLGVLEEAGASACVTAASPPAMPAVATTPAAHAAAVIQRTLTRFAFGAIRGLLG
ncbi:hypothetical protein ACWDTI_23635 [Gordonia sp. NPDC003424]